MSSTNNEDQVDDDGDLKVKKEEANPFSFKNFMAKSIPETTTNNYNNTSNPYSFNTLDLKLPNVDIPELETLPELEPSELIEKPDTSLIFEDVNTVENIMSLPDDIPLELSDQLAMKDSLISMQQAKIVKLERRLKELIEKEENENSALEKVVQQVEKKLLKATNRALESEKMVEILKQENKELKSQLKVVTSENLTLKQAQSSSVLKENKSKIGEIAGELSHVASAAESSLNQLLAGVNNLRLVASNLESLEKIIEIVDN